jgi:hypothetical protein
MLNTPEGEELHFLFRVQIFVTPENQNLFYFGEDGKEFSC